MPTFPDLILPENTASGEAEQSTSHRVAHTPPLNRQQTEMQTTQQSTAPPVGGGYLLAAPPRNFDTTADDMFES